MAPDLIINGKNGFLVEIDNYCEIAKKAKEIINEPKKIINFKKIARESVMVADWEKVSNAHWKNVYNPLLK